MIGMKKYFVYQADYQYWANDVLFNALDLIDDAARRSPQGLFFDSIHHTVDHIYVGTHAWFLRLKNEPTGAINFREVVHSEWRALKNALRQEVRQLQRWLDAQPESFFDEMLEYKSSDGKPRSNWVRDILTHVGSHMVHHRGQASAVATRLGAPAPEMDYIYYKREVADHLENFKATGKQ